MLKKLSKTIKAAFLCLFLSSIFISISPVLAIDPIQFEPQVEIPTTDSKDKIGGPVGKQVKGTDGKMYNSSDLLPRYIKAIYQYAIGAVGILAAVVMMYGGTLWILSMGNAERSTDAKSWIFAALSGLVLTLSAYSILYVVNPDLLNFKSLRIESIKKEEIDETTPPAAKTFTADTSSPDLTKNKEWARSDMKGICTTLCGGKTEYLDNIEITSEEIRTTTETMSGKYKYWTAACHCKILTCKLGVSGSSALNRGDECETVGGKKGNCYSGKCLIEKGKDGEECGIEPGMICRQKDLCTGKEMGTKGRNCDGLTQRCCAK